MPETGQTTKPMVEIGKRTEDCWKWMGKTLPAGYGCKTVNGKSVLAHRWMWEQLFGPIPHGLVIHHECQNPNCVNPHHLRACTQAENCRESVTTLLHPQDVVEIRRARKQEGPSLRKHLAEKFGCSQQLISDIWNRKAWRTKAEPFTGPKIPANQYTRSAQADEEQRKSG